MIVGAGLPCFIALVYERLRATAGRFLSFYHTPVTRFGPKVGKIDPKWDKSGDIFRSDSVHFVFFCESDLKISPDLPHLGAILHTLDPNLVAVCHTLVSNIRDG